MKKKILVTGVNGMLGSAIARELKKQETAYEIQGIGQSESNEILLPSQYLKLDLLNFTELKQLLVDLDPDIIIHCAAQVNLDLCENDKEYADKIHRDVTAVLASYKPFETRLIYISTDSVFDGTIGNYREDDKVNPLNYYALSKFHGEEAVNKEQGNAVIIRTNIYGFKKPGGKSLFEWIATKLSNGESITGFDDIFFNPLYTGQLATLIADMLRIDFSGVLHAGCNQFVSKYQFAVDIAKEFGWDTSLVQQGNSDNIISKLARPKNTTLNTNKVKQIFGYVPDYKLGLKQLFIDFHNK